MATSRTIIGTTPNGGVKATALFSDDRGNPVEENVATRMEILEYDDSGNVIHRTYGTIGPSADAPSPTGAGG